MIRKRKVVLNNHQKVIILTIILMVFLGIISLMPFYELIKKVYYS
ncbi:MAG: hypothetical protein WDA21_02300 [Bacilli bacterium]